MSDEERPVLGYTTGHGEPDIGTVQGPVQGLRTRLRAFYEAHGEPAKAANASYIIDTVLKKTGGDHEAAEEVMNKALAGIFNGDTLKQAK